jgi:hypothetical protein
VVSTELPGQSGPPLTEFELSVGERKILQFKRKPQITAVAEPVWNALDANATEVHVELRLSSMKAITDVVVTDNGHGMTPERARTALQAYGTTWKTRTHTEGGERILHGRNGEGRLFAFALGDQLTWDSAAVVGDVLVGVRIRGNADHATIWQVEETEPPQEGPARQSASPCPGASRSEQLCRQRPCPSQVVSLYTGSEPSARVGVGASAGTIGERTALGRGILTWRGQLIGKYVACC